MTAINKRLAELEKRQRRRALKDFDAGLCTIGMTPEEAEKAIAEKEAEAERLGFRGVLFVIDR